AVLDRLVHGRCLYDRRPTALFELERLERFSAWNRLVDERPYDAFRPDDFLELAAETHVVAIRGAEPEAIASTPPPGGLAARHRQAARSQPAFEMLAFREGVEHQVTRRVDDALGREAGLTGFGDDFEFS